MGGSVSGGSGPSWQEGVRSQLAGGGQVQLPGGVSWQGGQVQLPGEGQSVGGVRSQLVGGRGSGPAAGGVSILRPLAGGMPLAFTQEDFLVNITIFCHLIGGISNLKWKKLKYCTLADMLTVLADTLISVSPFMTILSVYHLPRSAVIVVKNLIICIYRVKNTDCNNFLEFSVFIWTIAKQNMFTSIR